MYNMVEVEIPKSTIDKMKRLIDDSDMLELEIGATLVIDNENKIDLINPTLGEWGSVPNGSSINRSRITSGKHRKIIGRFHTHPQDLAVPTDGDIEHVLFDDLYNISCIGSNYIDLKTSNSKMNTSRRQHIMCFSVKMPDKIEEYAHPNSELLYEQMIDGNSAVFNYFFDNKLVYTDSIKGDIIYKMENERTQRMLKAFHQSNDDLINNGCSKSIVT